MTPAILGLLFLVGGITMFSSVCGCYSGPCQAGWIQFRYHCYKYYPPDELTLTFNDAEAHCQSFSNPNGIGHLVSVHDQHENDFIYRLAKVDGINKDVWIGLNDENIEGSWVWTDGSTFSYHDSWHPNEPSNSGIYRNEDHVVMEYAGLWNDDNAYHGIRNAFICKMPSFDAKSCGCVGKACFSHSKSRGMGY